MGTANGQVGGNHESEFASLDTSNGHNCRRVLDLRHYGRGPEKHPNVLRRLGCSPISWWGLS